MRPELRIVLSGGVPGLRERGIRLLVGFLRGKRRISWAHESFRPATFGSAGHRNRRRNKRGGGGGGAASTQESENLRAKKTMQVRGLQSARKERSKERGWRGGGSKTKEKTKGARGIGMARLNSIVKDTKEKSAGEEKIRGTEHESKNRLQYKKPKQDEKIEKDQRER